MLFLVPGFRLNYPWFVVPKKEREMGHAQIWNGTQSNKTESKSWNSNLVFGTTKMPRRLVLSKDAWVGRPSDNLQSNPPQAKTLQSTPSGGDRDFIVFSAWVFIRARTGSRAYLISITIVLKILSSYNSELMMLRKKEMDKRNELIISNSMIYNCINKGS